MSVIAVTILMLITAYLLGSVSSAILVCKLRGLPDPRTQGSGNPGATNVLRIGGASSAAMVLFFDMLKGALPTYIGYKLNVDSILLGLVAVAACLGHIFPIFFEFKGGKGVATAFGAMAPIGEYLAPYLMITWLVMIIVTRYSSVASLTAAILAPILTSMLDDRFTIPVSMLSLLIIIRHKDNIIRLFNGTESRFTLKNKLKKNR